MNKTLKKILSLTLVLLIVFGSVSVAGTSIDISMSVDSKAYEFSSENDITSSSGNFVYRVKEDDKGVKSAAIVKYQGSYNDMEIPALVDGLPVTEILDGAFSGTEVKTVVIYGDDVTVCQEAFAQSKIKTVEIRAKKSKLLGLKNHFYLKTLNVFSENTEVSIEGADALKTVYCNGKVKSFSGLSMDNRPMTITFVGAYPKGFMSQISGLGYLYTINPTTEERIFFRDKKAAAPYDEETGFSYMVNSQDQVIVVDYKGERENVVIPDEIAGKPVCAIDDDAFKNKLFIRNVVLGKNVKRIGNSAFKNCQWLSQITFNENLEFIGESAFEECEALREVVIPDAVKEINSRTFYNCGMMPSVIAKGVEKIGAEAFSNDDGCTSLVTVEFSENLNAVEYAAFKNCSLLTSIGVSGENITTIGESAFERTGIRSFTFSAGLKEIPHKAFAETGLEEITLCEGMEKIGGFAKTNIKKIEIPSTVKVIEESAFEECSQLSEIILPDGLEQIGDKAFYKCSSIEMGSFPDTLTYIGESAFALCNNFGESVTIPEKVTFIGANAFGQTGIRELYFNAVSCDKVNDSFDNVIIAIIGEKVKRIPASLFKKCSSLKKAVISENVTEIGEYAFSHCENLEEINIPVDVEIIGEGAFEYCKNLEEITVPESITVFDGSVIAGCSSLKTVYYNAVNCSFTGLNDLISYGGFIIGKESPFNVAENVEIIFGNKVKAVPGYMYGGFYHIESVILPSSVTSIGEEAFANSSIKEIKLSDNLEVIGKKAFYNTDVRLSDDNFPATLKEIGEQAFRNCDEITEIYIPDTIYSIGDYAFCSCDNLTKVRMSPNVKTISAFAFAECVRLSEFIWDSETKVIGKDAFRNCRILTDFDFESVEKISENSFVGAGVSFVQLGENEKGEVTDLEVVEVAAFENCTNLKTLCIGGKVTAVKSAAFANCRKLETAVISPTVTSIAADAFDGCDLLTIYCVKDSYAHRYASEKGISVKLMTIDVIPAQVYTGEEIRPDVVVKMSDETLAENRDFLIEYSDNINIGIAKVSVRGKGIYNALSSAVNFRIIAEDIKNVAVSPVENQAYTGEEIMPHLVITNGKHLLKEGADYTVTYTNNTEPGTGTAEITGIGNYSGETTVTFEIVKQTFWQEIVSFFRMIIEAIRNFFVSIFR